MLHNIFTSTKHIHHTHSTHSLHTLTDPTDAPPAGSDVGRSTWATSTSQQASKLFGFMKEGAGTFFKNFKDSSSKIIETISSR